MNPTSHLCLVCQQIATRVCIHPTCDKIPFLCGNTCKHGYNLAVIAHTHDGQAIFLPYNQIYTKIQKIKQSVPPKDYANDIKKRILRIIGDLNKLMERVDKEIGTKEMLLKKDLIEIVEVFLGGDKEKSKGRMFWEFMDCKNVWEETYYDQQKIGKFKQELQKLLKSLEDIIFSVVINNQPKLKKLKKSINNNDFKSCWQF